MQRALLGLNPSFVAPTSGRQQRYTKLRQIAPQPKRNPSRLSVNKVSFECAKSNRGLSNMQTMSSVYFSALPFSDIKLKCLFTSTGVVEDMQVFSQTVTE